MCADSSGSSLLAYTTYQDIGDGSDLESLRRRQSIKKQVLTFSKNTQQTTTSADVSLFFCCCMYLPKIQITTIIVSQIRLLKNNLKFPQVRLLQSILSYKVMLCMHSALCSFLFKEHVSKRRLYKSVKLLWTALYSVVLRF